MCVSVTACHMCVDVLGGQKGVLKLTDLEKQVVLSAVIYFFHWRKINKKAIFYLEES